MKFLYVFGCPVYIHNDKDHLGKFDEKAYDGYILRYSLISKAFRVFSTRRQQTEETYHITFDESLDAIKFSKSSVDNINIVETKRYPPDEYLHPFSKQEGIDYDETFAPSARLEAITIFLAFSTYMNFIVYQMDVKSAFLNDLTFNSQLVSVQDIKQILRNPTLLLLREFSDSDYAGCNMDRKNTSDACQLLGGKVVCWSAIKQQCVATSSAKVENVVASGCCANILWMKSQLTDYDIIYEKVVPNVAEARKIELKLGISSEEEKGKDL
uniref:Retrovirus-related Pol polyprotein from transposon TNT 1-94 n=1 Tax=Tanacetum cinerariifolium TaxID=118510 RepID=A0A6L2KJX1_TANCI|nr:retrovirus-related Pol polyprotein from transposon TNT 1-94 [Tanacetum cinerariifolium]